MSTSTNTLKKVHQKSAAKALLLSSKTSSPARPEHKPVSNESGFAKLPFVYRPKHGFNNASNWHTPPTEDYAQACEIGGEYAAHFAQYLKDNPDMCGANSLGIIARDIDFENTSSTAGYWVGFFSHLERMILAQAQCTDVHSAVDRAHAFYAGLKSRRANEEPASKHLMNSPGV